MLRKDSYHNPHVSHDAIVGAFDRFLRQNLDPAHRTPMRWYFRDTPGLRLLHRSESFEEELDKTLAACIREHGYEPSFSEDHAGRFIEMYPNPS